MKNRVTEMKNTLEGINSRLGEAEDESDLKDKVAKNTQSQQQYVFFIVIQLQLSVFSPHPSSPPQPNPPPSPTSTLPLEFVHVSFLHSSSCKPLFPLSPPHSPLAIVRLFLTSMSLVIFCLFFSLVDYVTQWNSTQQRERRSLYPLQ